ncbi:hypothetical protein PVAP13_9KG249539 [Panicum virgatum]|uniref:Uncharacterized protein n=1 Tax=Panicum virgatum TaxID=38727 RepID=A0A8T0NLW2_PANVG|nr:hypothetical protein PVAP13_9KG249539 [Panicum virgatum]
MLRGQRHPPHAQDDKACSAGGGGGTATWATTVSPPAPAPSTPSVAGGRTTAAVSAVAALLDSAGGDLLPSSRERAVAVLAAFASSGAACRFLAEEAGAVHACAALLPLTAASRDASAAVAARGGVAAVATRGRLPPRARREDRGRAAAEGAVVDAGHGAVVVRELGADLGLRDRRAGALHPGTGDDVAAAYRLQKAPDRHRLPQARRPRDRRRQETAAVRGMRVLGERWRAGEEEHGAARPVGELCCGEKETGESEERESEGSQIALQGYFGHFTCFLSALNHEIIILLTKVSHSKYTYLKSVHKQRQN